MATTKNAKKAKPADEGSAGKPRGKKRGGRSVPAPGRRSAAEQDGGEPPLGMTVVFDFTELTPSERTDVVKKINDFTAQKDITSSLVAISKLPNKPG